MEAGGGRTGFGIGNAPHGLREVDVDPAGRGEFAAACSIIRPLRDNLVNCNQAILHLLKITNMSDISGAVRPAFQFPGYGP